jgi:cyclopropane fatty-acyl-phospholipid synthase-like methyltransferase
MSYAETLKRKEEDLQSLANKARDKQEEYFEAMYDGIRMYYGQKEAERCVAAARNDLKEFKDR